MQSLCRNCINTPCCTLQGPGIGEWHKPVPTLARSGQQAKPVIQSDEAELLESLVPISEA